MSGPSRRWMRPIHGLRRRAFPALAVLTLVLCSGLSPGGSQDRVRAQTNQPPDVILILTDDQRADSLTRMPHVQRLLVEQGMQMDHAIVSTPLCCPSRATILTGRYSHSTTVYTNEPPNGGWAQFNGSGSEESTIATALRNAGYRTGLIGKYLNGYKATDGYVPPGWDRWFATVSTPGSYYDYTAYDDAHGLLSFGSDPTDYLTDVLKIRAKRFIRGTSAGTPLFLMVTPFAPHGPSTPAPRHAGAFAEAQVELGQAANEKDVSDKPAHIQVRKKTDPARIVARTRLQWESLLAVDEMVRAIVNTLEQEGRLQNTVLIYTSDNGFSNWEHRWHGKQVPYEESIRVPLVIRADGHVPSGTVSRALVSNVDIAPTIVDFAGIGLPDAEGVSIRPLVTDSVSSIRDSVVLEFVTPPDSPIPTYCGVATRDFMFAHYTTGEEELYDLGQDPWQLQNVVSARPVKADLLRTLTMSLCLPTPPGFSW